MKKNEPAVIAEIAFNH